MTNRQYWDERKQRIKLVNGAYLLCEQKGLIGGKLSELLLAKYGKQSFVLMEDSEIQHFKEWLQR